MGSLKSQKDEEDMDDVREVLNRKRREQNWSMKVKRNPTTERLFHDTCRMVRNLNIIDSFVFKRVRCYTRNSTVFHLPVDYNEPVLYTGINRRKVDLKNTLRNKSTTWMTVMKKFYHEKSDFDVSEILCVRKPWFGRRVVYWFKRVSSSNENSKCLDTYVYPHKKCVRVPIQDLERNCQLCDSPKARCYKSLSSAIEDETMPFILTIPFDPFTRSVQKGSNRNNSKSSYFEKLVIDGIETFEVLLTCFGDDQNVTAVVVPSNVTFNVGCSTDISPEKTTPENVTDSGINTMYKKLEPLLMELDNVDGITLIDLEIESQNDEQTQQTEYQDSFEEFEMKCILKYKASFRRSESTPGSPSEEDPLITKKHQYYNVVDETAPMEESQEDGDEEEIDMVSFDDDGNILIGRSCSRNNNDYLSPLTEFTKGYTHFKRALRDSTEEGSAVPGVVVGRDGYVQVSEKEEEERRLREEEEQKRNKKKLGFWKRKKEKALVNTTRGEARILEDDSEKIVYYTPMFNIHQEKPELPPKNVSPKPPVQSPPEQPNGFMDQDKVLAKRPQLTKQQHMVVDNNSEQCSLPDGYHDNDKLAVKRTQSAEQQPVTVKIRPDLPTRSKSVLKYKHTSMKPLLESFDEVTDDNDIDNNADTRKSVKRKSAPGLNSRIHYFEAKNIVKKNNNTVM